MLRAIIVLSNLQLCSHFASKVCPPANFAAEPKPGESVSTELPEIAPKPVPLHPDMWAIRSHSPPHLAVLLHERP